MNFLSKKLKGIVFMVLLVLFSSICITTSFAVPQQPINVYGYAFLSLNGINATNDTNITTKINDIYSESTLTYNNNFYTLLLQATDNDNITFYIDNNYSTIWTVPAYGGSYNLDIFINNNAPTINAISDIIINEQQTVIITPNATDLDGDNLTYTTNNSNLIWDNNSKTFKWTTTYNDSGNYTINVTVSDSVFTSSTTFNLEVIDLYHKYDRPLKKGWNLISFPYEQDSTSVVNVLSALAGNYTRVDKFDSKQQTFKIELPGSGSYIETFHTLKNISNTEGFWINMTQEDTLEIIGKKTLPTITLNSGWNMISYPFDYIGNISCMLDDIKGNFSIIWEFDESELVNYEYEKWNSHVPNKPPILNKLNIFRPGYGYWINMNVTDTLNWENNICAP